MTIWASRIHLFASFFWMPPLPVLDLWGGDYRGGAYTVPSKEDSMTEYCIWLSICRWSKVNEISM